MKTAGNKGSCEILGHPKGLAFIVFTEAWERFSFYGMQALLVLYMVNYILLPENSVHVLGFDLVVSGVESVFGALSITALATQLFGLYIGLIYLMPVFGGLIGDRFIGRTKAVLSGAILMSLGHFMMAFESLFFLALALLIIGCGLLKGNLAAQVGSLYEQGDQRRDAAFSLYSVAINIGGFVAPLVCGTLGELYGWHYGFNCAGVGMLFGMLIYMRGQKFLPKENEDVSRQQQKGVQEGDGKVIISTVCVILITALYWTVQSQVWNTYPIWVRDNVDRSFFSFTIPITWFQSLDMFAVLILAPVIIMLWKKQNRRQSEPNGLIKITIGCAVFAMANIWLSLGGWVSDGEKIALIWPVVFHFICALGYLYVGPVALALVSQSAPPYINATMMGSYYLAIFVGGIFSGYLGRFYELLSPSEFWMLHGAIVGCASFIILVSYKPLASNLIAK
ncbi:peptide MFS transporter [Alteromonas sp. C1M14]|uniref:peptide MFS transporter n=1 Tax=Alteromonas sp. C1M14 TaxID=2841567 RepID=UPI001C08D089|nr:peptide MFS transporter [Alteromonas sp. C1M14]MBU2978234.1 peptide MFS transporter [Alteromonas sp. C1M14]